MKRLFPVLLLALFASASTVQIEREIYSTALQALFPNKKSVIIWTDNRKKYKLFQKLSIHTKMTNDMERADLLIVYKNLNIKTDKPLFAGSYIVLKHYKENAVGGFYWKKGRPNLVFLKKNLHKYHMKLPKELERYEEEAL